MKKMLLIMTLLWLPVLHTSSSTTEKQAALTEIQKIIQDFKIQENRLISQVIIINRLNPGVTKDALEKQVAQILSFTKQELEKCKKFEKFIQENM